MRRNTDLISFVFLCDVDDADGEVEDVVDGRDAGDHGLKARLRT